MFLWYLVVIGNIMKDLEEHHTKYKEIHGIDETIFLTRSEHRLLHKRLRNDGKCTIPVNILRAISKQAYKRTSKGKISNSKSKMRTCKTIQFYEQLIPNLRLQEIITYNINTGNVWCSSCFVPSNNKQLWEELI